MEASSLSSVLPAAMMSELESRKRTIIALLAASAISLVVWGLVVALNVQ